MIINGYGRETLKGRNATHSCKKRPKKDGGTGEEMFQKTPKGETKTIMTFTIASCSS